MAVGNSVNDEIREQHQKLKGKSPKEKFEYFWEYYKVHTIAAVLVVAMLSSIIYTAVTRKEIVLDVTFVNTWVLDELNTEQLASDFLAYAGIDPEENTTLFTTNMYIDYEGGGDQYTMANIQKMNALTASASLDVLVCDENYIHSNVGQQLFYDLSEALPAELFERCRDRLLYIDMPDDGKGEIPIGIDMKDSPWMLSNELPAWFCIVVNTQHLDNCVQFLQFMLEASGV